MRRLLLRIALALGSSACGLMLANVVLERAFPLPAVLYRPDADLIHRPIRGARVVRPVLRGGTSSWVTSEINSQGFRGRELRVPKCGPRIAVYGDSFVFAEDVPLAETFVERLGQALAPENPPEMVNAGVVGYGPDQACLRFEKEERDLAPDLVVLVLYSGNDFGDLLRNKLFRLDSSEKAVPNRVALAPELRAAFAAWDRAASQPALVRFCRAWRDERAERARCIAAGPRADMIEWLLARDRDEYSEYLLDPTRVRSVWQDHYDADLALYPECESSRLKCRLMRAVLERLRDDCARCSVPLAAVVVPAPHDIWPAFGFRVDRAKFPGWSPSRHTDVLAEILADLGVPCVNLYAPFRDGDAGRFYFGGTNVHWNATGQELAAHQTAALLLERGLWPPNAAHTSRMEPAQAERIARPALPFR